MTGEAAASVPAMEANGARFAANAAAVACSAWRALGPNARRTLASEAADTLKTKATEFVVAMMGVLQRDAGDGHDPEATSNFQGRSEDHREGIRQLLDENSYKSDFCAYAQQYQKARVQ